MKFSFIKDPAPMFEQPKGAVPQYHILTTEVYQTALKAYMPAHIIKVTFDNETRTVAMYANRSSAEVVVEALRATAEDTTWAKYG